MISIRTCNCQGGTCCYSKTPHLRECSREVRRSAGDRHLKCSACRKKPPNKPVTKVPKGDNTRRRSESPNSSESHIKFRLPVHLRAEPIRRPILSHNHSQVDNLPMLFEDSPKCVSLSSSTTLSTPISPLSSFSSGKYPNGSFDLVSSSSSSSTASAGPVATPPESSPKVPASYRLVPCACNKGGKCHRKKHTQGVCDCFVKITRSDTHSCCKSCRYLKKKTSRGAPMSKSE